MNKDLMMKAAIQFNGKWPSDEQFENEKVPRDGAILHTRKISPDHPDEEVGCISLGGDGANTDFYDIITKEQFESFVESLFEGAPEGATHYSPEDDENHACFYKDEYKQTCIRGESKWSLTKHTIFEPVIIRQAKRADPALNLNCRCASVDIPYTPKVGEECQFSSVGHHSGFMWCIFRGVMSDGGLIVEYHHNTSPDRVTCDAFDSLNTAFRPLRTERDLFIEAATAAYLKQVGSDAVDKKWFGRIFGALHDEGFKAP